MKIRYASDIHLDRDPDYTLPVMEGEKDQVLVLAGDFSNGFVPVNFLNDCSTRFKEVIAILGNHDYYHRDIISVIREWRDYEKTSANVNFLNDGAVVIDGVRFLGTTLWSNFRNGDWFVKETAKRNIADFHFIRDHAGIKMHPDCMLKMHTDAVKFLEDALNEPFDGKTVVVSHFVPMMALRDMKFPFDDLSWYFSNDLNDLIDTHCNKISAWIYGHTHKSDRIKIQGIEFIINTRGYIGHNEHTNFNPLSVLEIDR